MTVPTTAPIDDIYGQMLTGRFGSAAPAAAPEPGKRREKACEFKGFSKETNWCDYRFMAMGEETFLPTPSKFFYVFNMRDLSRVFKVL